MTRGRRPSLIPSRTVQVPIPTSVLEAVDARLYDPRTGKPVWGARASLITRLLAEWVERTPVNPRLEGPRPDLESLLPSATE